MTLTLLDLLAQALTTLVITLLTGLALVGGVIMYVRRLHTNIMHAIASLQAAIDGLQHTDTTIADEQHTQTGLLQRITEILTVANKQKLIQADARAADVLRQQEITRFLINSNFFTGQDNQHRLLLDLPAPVLIMVDADRYPNQSTASLLATIVKAAGEYSQLPTLAASVAAVLNGSQTGTEWAVRCAGWGIRLPPHEGDHE